MLGNPITLNVGSPAADVVFNRAYSQGNSAIFYADSPNGDLAGRYVLRVSHEETSTGIVRSLVQLKKPLQNANGEYDQFIQMNMTITRPGTAELTDVDEVLEMAQEIWADDTGGFRSAIGEAEL